MTNALEIGGISKSFGSHKAIENITFQVKKGEIFGFLGPNGAGKTTTIRCLMDFIRPDAGEIKILGKDAQASSVAIKNLVGYVASDHHLVEKWTVREHLEYIVSLRGAGRNYKGLLDRFSLDLDRRAKVLSTGNRQKLNLILGLVGEPKVLVLDEPTQGLDPLFQHEVYQLLEDFRRSGGTVFISSHNLAEVQRICGRVAIINKGRLVAVESLESLRQKAQYVVRVRSAKPLPKSVLQSDQVTIRSQAKHEVTFLVRGDLNLIVKMLAKHKLSDLEITHASLEEVFLEMYS